MQVGHMLQTPHYLEEGGGGNLVIVIGGLPADNYCPLWETPFKSYRMGSIALWDVDIYDYPKLDATPPGEAC